MSQALSANEKICLFNLENLSEIKVREFMLHELQKDIEEQKLYISQRLKHSQKDLYIKLLHQSFRNKDIEYLFIEANPYELPQGGGTSTITAYAKDKNMEPVEGKDLWLECDAGTLSNTGYFITDKNGKIRTTLSTDKQSIVEVKYKSLTESVTIKIKEAKPPISSFVYSPSNLYSGDTVYFNAEESSDDDGYIVTYKWNFGDGTTGTGKTISHVYTVSEEKTFYVTLKVKDNDGNETVSKQQITIKI